jgi:hypothetical protein
MHMARYSGRDDHGYRAVSGVSTDLCSSGHNGSRMYARPSPLSSAISKAYKRLLLLYVGPFAKDDLFVVGEDIIAKLARAQQLCYHTHAPLLLGL